MKRCVMCGAPSIRGLKPNQGLCQKHWNEAAFGHITTATDRIYRVEGFGEVGHANLAGFVPNPGFKSHRDLELNEMTEGTASMCGVHNAVRLWRAK